MKKARSARGSAVIVSSNNELFFIDTSLPIYAAGKPSQHKESCSMVLEMVEKGRINAVIDTEVIQELLHRFHRLDLERQGLELSQNVLRLGMPVLPVLKKNIEETLVLFEKYSRRKVPPRDILHAAVMLDNDIGKVITVDKHYGDVIEEVEGVEPESFF